MANNIPNTGETFVTIPVDIRTSTQGRFKLTCADNIFFAVSIRNFFVTQDDNSITVQFNNENQKEPNLSDLPLNSEPVISSTTTNTNTTNVTGTLSNDNGGGLFEFLQLFLLIFINKLYRTRQLKI